MDPMDYFFMEEFMFPEEGGVTGTRRVACPQCGCEFDLKVDVGNTNDVYQCGECQCSFAVNWQDGTIQPVD